MNEKGSSSHISNHVMLLNYKEEALNGIHHLSNCFVVPWKHIVVADFLFYFFHASSGFHEI